MHNDIKLFKWAIALLLVPVALSFCGKDSFRYPCQNPENWDKEYCKVPVCDVTRTCPEHIFKGQRDPRLGPPKNGQTQPFNQPLLPTGACVAQQTQGANCGK